MIINTKKGICLYNTNIYGHRKYLQIVGQVDIKELDYSMKKAKYESKSNCLNLIM